MRCANCGYAKTYVVKTILPMDKPVEDVKQRRRICNGCKNPFMTFEINEEEFKRLCTLIESEGPTRRPLKSRLPRRPLSS